MGFVRTKGNKKKEREKPAKAKNIPEAGWGDKKTTSIVEYRGNHSPQRKSVRWGTGPEVTGEGEQGPSTMCWKTELD